MASFDNVTVYTKTEIFKLVNLLKTIEMLLKYKVRIFRITRVNTIPITHFITLC